MKTVLVPTILAIAFLSGCASVPMESPEKSKLTKQFNAPPEGKAGLYIYRSSGVGTALKKDIWVNGKCIGETAPNMFFYEAVNGNEEHKISTESEFSPNDLSVTTKTGQNYFINQYIKIGLFVGGAGIELVDENKGKKDVSELELAIKGTCSK